ncbi:CPBP family intramembrane glutamic endopeptidase [Treponema pedis]|uniref:CPBP family intramembrane metalloprotease n=1 Tax=Treponema pedis TaxID=409322 RepID=A0A7S7AWS7_9SPIR|nr:CPBP family intramembrane glutamic endopeptidase [Treponema pedis]QOW60936.1 CPBP family intramembrane metalloprotease [Treponema pedis]
MKNKDKARILRRCFFILPLYLTLFIGFNIEFNIRILLFSLIGFTFALFLILLNFRSWRLVLNKDIILSQNLLSISNCASRAIYLILTAIGEELFFRNLFLTVSTPTNKLYMIFISTLCFVTMHINNKTREIQKFDMLLEAVFSIFSGFLYILSNSCVPSIIAHISFNFPYALIDIKYIYCKLKKG